MASIFDTERFTESKYFFRVQKWGWRFIGFWPGNDIVSTFRLVLATLNGLEVLIYGYFQMNFLLEHSDNLVILLDAMTPWVTQVTSAMKMFIIMWRRHDIQAILGPLKKSFDSG